MIWIWRVIAASLLIVAGVNASAERRTHLQPRSDSARRLSLMFPPSRAARVFAADDGIYHVRIRDCPRPLTIAVAPPSFTPRAALLNLAAPGDRTLYAYTDWSGAEPDRPAVFARRLWQPLLSSMRLNDYSRLREMLVIAEPSGCNIAASARWDNYWRNHVTW
jgi:hypothetical protein